MVGALRTFNASALTVPSDTVSALAVRVKSITHIQKASTKTEYEQMTFKQTFLIGLSQALAFIPGVSRSGVTMTTARSMGIKREAAAK